MRRSMLLLFLTCTTATLLNDDVLRIPLNTSHTVDKSCPPGSYVTGFKLRSHALYKDESKHWTFRGLSGLILLCGTRGTRGELEFTSPGYHDPYTVARHCPCDTRVTSTRIRSAEGIINSINMYCAPSDGVLVGSGQHAGGWDPSMVCPTWPGAQSYIVSAKVQFTEGRIASANFICKRGRALSTCETKVKPPDPAHWAPLYHFDPEHRCYPDPILEELSSQGYPQSQYAGQCRRHHDPSVPVYYTGVQCGSSGYQLNYRLYYGYQRPCFLSLGKHSGDWEHVRLNFVLCGTEWCIDSVTYHQHDGWFTVPYVGKKDPLVQVWVAQIGHASFPISCSKSGAGEQRCAGGCLYFDDYHREGGVRWRPSVIQAVQADTQCEPLACQGQSCTRNQWFFGETLP